MDAISRIPLRCDTPGEIGEIDTILYFDVVQMQSDTEYFIGCIVNLTEPAGSVTSPILPLNIIWSPADSQLIEPPGVMRMEANGGAPGEIDIVLHIGIVQMQSNVEYLATCIINLTEPPGSIISPVTMGSTNPIWSLIDPRLIESPGIIDAKSNSVILDEVNIVLHFDVVQMQSDLEYFTDCVINLTESPGNIISPTSTGPVNAIWSLVNLGLIEPSGTVRARFNSVILDEINIVLYFDAVQVQSDLEYLADCIINLMEPPGGVTSPISTDLPVNSRLIELPGVMRAKFNGGILGEIDAILYFDAVQMQSNAKYLANCTVDLTELPGDVNSPILTNPINNTWSLIDPRLIEPLGIIRARFNCVIPSKIDTVLHFDIVQMQSDLEYLADCTIDLTESPGDIVPPISTGPVIDSRLIEPPGTTRAVLYCVIPDKIDTVLYFNVVQMQSDMEYLADCIVNLTEVAGSINSIYSLPNIINSLANSRLIEPPGTVHAERDRHMINQVRLTGNMRQPQGVLTVETVGTSECSAFLIQISGKLQTKLVDDFKISLVESAGEIYGINIPSVDEARWLRSFMNNMGRGIN
ncbi:MAG: hypothetical protein N0E48_15995 [Candidatus Thiodiazotropha endolucinida]|nr:hypothetical protein [Candidatus Thiodiazotropha taylori]MCW4344833.1 hypothetical protein [Candidatus Thiodiazotropha endolucinida]